MQRGRSEELLARAARFDAWAATRSSVREVDAANFGYPQFVSHARGGHIWDLDGNRYVDLVLGYGPVVLGHADPRVQAAVVRSLASGVCMSPMWSPLQAELTELLVGTIPHAERAYLMKTGSDATAAAIRLARIFTGREKVLKWGYNGWHDWTAPRPAGVPKSVREDTLWFEYNSLASLEEKFSAHSDTIACVIMMPFELEPPRPGFLHAVAETARRHGALFIIDDMRSGFRLALGGSQEFFGLKADLATFSKAMANGFPISAVVGRADILDGLSQTHMASTFYANPAEMAAAVETVSILRDTDALDRIRRHSDQFFAQLRSLIETCAAPVSLRGLACSPFIEFPQETQAEIARKVAFYEATLERGVLLHPNHQWFFCADHTDDDIDQALDACDAGLKAAFGAPKKRSFWESGADPITVVTLTRRRPDQLLRAVASVREQDYPGPVEHVVVVDDDPATAGLLGGVPTTTHRSIRWLVVDRSPQDRDGRAEARTSVYPRISRLLNIGVKVAGSPWVAFLDDDNAYEPNHLSSLMSCALETRSLAVHSARAIYRHDGTPYLDAVFPWAPSRLEGRRIYELMVHRGVWKAGTNLMLDRVDPVQTSFRNSTILNEDDPVFLVDQNLWLVKRSLLLALPYAEVLSEEEIAQNTCPDDKFLQSLFEVGEKITSSGLATVRYYLGGISNGPIETGPDLLDDD